MKRIAIAVVLAALAGAAPSASTAGEPAPPGCQAVGTGPMKAGSAECVFTSDGDAAPVYAFNLGDWRVWVWRRDASGELRDVTLAEGYGPSQSEITGALPGEQVHAAIFYACLEGEVWVSGVEPIRVYDPTAQSCGWGWIGAGDATAWRTPLG